MAVFSIEQYVESLIPNAGTVIPGYSTATAINGAMALYWSYLFQVDPATGQLPDLDETNLSERQKYMIGLRVAVTLLPVLNSWFSAPQVLEAVGGPASAKFQDLPRLIKVLLPLWQTDLSNLEAGEDIFFTLLPTVPAYLQLIQTTYYPLPGETNWLGTPVVQSGTFFEGGSNE